MGEIVYPYKTVHGDYKILSALGLDDARNHIYECCGSNVLFFEIDIEDIDHEIIDGMI